MRDVATKVNSTTTLADEDWNDVYADIKNFLESMDLTLTDADLTQTAQAVTGYTASFAAKDPAGSTGAAYTLATIGNKVAQGQIYDGGRMRFVCPIESTIKTATFGIDALPTKLTFFEGSTGGSGFQIPDFLKEDAPVDAMYIDNSYTIFPGPQSGFLQSGVITSPNTDSGRVIEFDSAFANGIPQVCITVMSTLESDGILIDNVSLTGFELTNTTSNSVDVHWMAIGDSAFSAP